MSIHVRSLLGKPLSSKEKPLGCIAAVHFFRENGKFAGIQSTSRKFFSADDILFEEDRVQTTASEARKSEGENWLGFAAKTAKGQHLGEIVDVEFESDIKIITRLTVLQKFLFFPISKRIFAYERIIDVRNRTVVFNCDTTLQEKLPALNGSVVNLPASRNQYFHKGDHDQKIVSMR